MEGDEDLLPFVANIVCYIEEVQDIVERSEHGMSEYDYDANRRVVLAHRYELQERIAARFERGHFDHFTYRDEISLMRGIAQHLRDYGEFHLLALVFYNRSGIFAYGYEIEGDVRRLYEKRDR
jgi:hypothetical protein